MDSLRAETIQRDHESDPPDRVEGLLDINVLPQRYRPQRPAFTTILAWLLFVVLVGLLYLSFQRFQEGTQRLATQRLRFEAAQEALQAAEVQPAEIEQLQADVDTLRTRADQLERALDQLDLQTIQWGPRLSELVEQAPNGVRLTGVSQSGEQVLINGLTDAYQQPLEYRDRLKQVEELGDVILLSIGRVEAESVEAELTPTEQPAEEEDGEEAAAATPAPPFLYEFQLQVTIPGAVPPTPTSEVSQ